MSRDGRAWVVLEDGLVLEARSVAAPGTALGEMVFTTGMTGYQEAVTDPSYLGQILCFAAPMIGNYGAGPGPRRERPALAGGGGDGPRRRRPGRRRADRLARVAARARRGGRRRLRHPPPGAPPARPRARCAAGSPTSSAPTSCWRGCASTRCSTGATWPAEAAGARAGPGRRRPARGGGRLRDEGEHRRAGLVAAGCRLDVVPAGDDRRPRSSARGPDGVFVSNGPGDPAAVDPGHRGGARAAGARCPVFGICLGHQMLAHALGLTTRKLRLRPPRRQPPGAPRRPTAAWRSRCRTTATRSRPTTCRTASRSRARASSTARSRASPRRSCAPGRCSTTPRRARGRATRATCSASSRRPSG